MNVECLGSGAGFNFLEGLGDTSFIVWNASDIPTRHLLFDCGPSVPKRLIENGYIEKITDIVITHMHNDHVGGLETLAYYIYFKLGKKRITLHFASSNFAKTLWENSLLAGMVNMQDFSGKPFRASLETFFDVSIGENIVMDGLCHGRYIPVEHVADMECYSIALRDKVFFTGDTKYALKPKGYGYIFHDCNFSDPNPHNIHVTYEDLKKIPYALRNKYYLVHLSEGRGRYDPKDDGFAGYCLPGMILDVGGE